MRRRRRRAGRLSASFTPQKVEFMKAGGSYAIVFGKKLQSFACETLGIPLKSAFAPSKEISHEGQGLTAVEKIFNANAVGTTPGKVLHAGSDVRVKVNIVGSQDTTGLMTSAGARSDGRDGDLADGRRRLSVGLPHRLGVGLKAQANTRA
jgi:aconitase B